MEAQDHATAAMSVDTRGQLGHLQRHRWQEDVENLEAQCKPPPGFLCLASEFGIEGLASDCNLVIYSTVTS
jgi:hypothetical protein